MFTYCNRCCLYVKNYKMHEFCQSHIRRVNIFNTNRIKLLERFTRQHISLQNYHEYHLKRRNMKKCIEKCCMHLLPYDSPLYTVRCFKCRLKQNKCLDHEYGHKTADLYELV